MSIYDQRDTAAYEHYRTDLQDAKNPFILSWWTREHDVLLKTLIIRYQWVWYWSATDEIVAITPPNVLEAWRRSDPRCRSYAWYNVLMYFAGSRADEFDLTRLIRQPQARNCLMCKEQFIEDSLPVALVARLGVERLEFCAPCLRDTVLQGTGDPGVSRDAICTYLRDLAALIGSVPAQGFGEGLDDLHGFETNERLAILHLLRRKPTVGRVKEIFGSWLGALVQAAIEGRCRRNHERRGERESVPDTAGVAGEYDLLVVRTTDRRPGDVDIVVGLVNDDVFLVLENRWTRGPGSHGGWRCDFAGGR